ncbi:MAG: ABC transporter permease [Anaerolineales bacterium]|nr:ABC transporter permease [Anaerolineales bacterium]
MNKIMVIARREFLQRLRSRAFLFTAIGTPLILIIVWFFAGDVNIGSPPPEQESPIDSSSSEETIGFVDQADLIRQIPDSLPQDLFQAYPDRSAAEQALNQGEISSFYLVDADFRESGEVQLISLRLPTSPPETEVFEWLLLKNTFPDLEEGVFNRLYRPLLPDEPRFISIAGEADEASGGTGNSMLPFIVTMAIMLPLFTGGGYLLQSLAKEKGSRIMEVLLLTVRPRQLLTGKLIGLGALVLVQYALWILIGGGLAAVLGQERSSLLGSIQITPEELVFVLPLALGGFCLYAALMGGLGALAPDLEGSRSWTFLITLPMMVPIYFWTAVTTNPQGPLAVFLSLFPYSSPVAMLLRMSAGSVPLWQLGLSISLLLIAVVATIWLMSRLFRAQTLLSGEPLSLQRFWSAVRVG